MRVNSIFEDYNEKQINEAHNLLKKRLKVNNLNLSFIKNKNVLNVCDPSGRYTSALYKLGARSVQTFNETVKPKNWNKNFHYKKIDLSKKIFSNQIFDFIFCNGILSHKRNWKNIINQFSKHLRNDGYLWLSLYSNGMHWYYADQVKKKLNNKTINNFILSLMLRDWEPNKINFLVELFYKERIYFKKKQIYQFLKSKNFSEIIFLNRGLDTDLNEKVFNDKKLKKIYGEGEIRLLAKKKD